MTTTSLIGRSVGISVPVVIDFKGTLARGVSDTLSLQGLSITAGKSAKPEQVVTVYFCFARDYAYLRLSGRVVSITEEPGDFGEASRIGIRFDSLTEIESTVLQSCLEECERYLDRLDGRPCGTNRAPAINARTLLSSLFVTDNPYTLPYRPMSLRREEPGARDRNGQAADPRSSQAAPPRLTASFVWESLGLCAQLLRDLLIRLLPARLARLIAPSISFAFIAHPRDLSDVPRKFPFARLLSPRTVERWFRYQWPFVASAITGLKTAEGLPATGAMLISPLTTEQMLRNPELARKRIFQTVRLAEKMGAKIAGLGAFTSIVTRDGRTLAGKVRIGLTTGNPHSAAIAVQNVLEAATLTSLSLPHATAAVIGGAGSVGSACAKLLAPLVAKLILVDLKKEELKALASSLEEHGVEISTGSSLEPIKNADIVIAATNSPHIIVSPQHLKAGAIVIDAAQPKNVSEQVPLVRPDVLVIESAIVETPGVDCHFDLGLGPGEALGCLSETMILTAMGWQGDYSLGKADPRQAAGIIAAGRQLGFRLAQFRNSVGYVTGQDLARVSRVRQIDALRA
ncbi:PilZ domain-containing protein [Candidatus Nitrospira bockiana]